MLPSSKHLSLSLAWIFGSAPASMGENQKELVNAFGSGPIRGSIMIENQFDSFRTDAKKTLNFPGNLRPMVRF
jgi:hypothetical protein